MASSLLMLPRTVPGGVLAFRLPGEAGTSLETHAAALRSMGSPPPSVVPLRSMAPPAAAPTGPPAAIARALGMRRFRLNQVYFVPAKPEVDGPAIAIGRDGQPPLSYFDPILAATVAQPLVGHAVMLPSYTAAPHHSPAFVSSVAVAVTHAARHRLQVLETLSHATPAAVTALRLWFARHWLDPFIDYDSLLWLVATTRLPARVVVLWMVLETLANPLSPRSAFARPLRNFAPSTIAAGMDGAASPAAWGEVAARWPGDWPRDLMRGDSAASWSGAFLSSLRQQAAAVASVTAGHKRAREADPVVSGGARVPGEVAGEVEGEGDADEAAAGPSKRARLDGGDEVAGDAAPAASSAGAVAATHLADVAAPDAAWHSHAWVTRSIVGSASATHGGTVPLQQVVEGAAAHARALDDPLIDESGWLSGAWQLYGGIIGASGELIATDMHRGEGSASGAGGDGGGEAEEAGRGPPWRQLRWDDAAGDVVLAAVDEDAAPSAGARAVVALPGSTFYSIATLRRADGTMAAEVRAVHAAGPPGEEARGASEPRLHGGGKHGV